MKKTTIARICIPNPYEACRVVLPEEILHQALWQHVCIKQTEIAQRFESIGVLNFRLECPRPLKQKGKLIGWEPHKVIVFFEGTIEDLSGDCLEEIGMRLGTFDNVSFLHAMLPREFSPSY